MGKIQGFWLKKTSSSRVPVAGSIHLGAQKKLPKKPTPNSIYLNRITAESTTTPTLDTVGPATPVLGGKANNVFTTDEEDALSDQGRRGFLSYQTRCGCSKQCPISLGCTNESIA